MKSTIAIAAAALAAASSHSAPAQAQAFSSSAAGWDIVKIEGGCGAFAEFGGPGDTKLGVTKDTTGKIGIGITNANWSAVLKQEYALSYFLDGQVYEGKSSIGFAEGGRKGFLAAMRPEFEQDFARASTLLIKMGDVVVDRLDLDGSAAAINQVNRCLSAVRSEQAAEAKEQARYAGIAKDPFAEGPRNPELLNTSTLAARVNVHPLARSEHHGVVEFIVNVSATGENLGCEVATSSGDELLDDATCSIVSRYAKFRPAIGKDGAAIAGEYRSKVTWTTPSL